MPTPILNHTNRPNQRRVAALFALAVALASGTVVRAQICTTQAKMPPAQRDSLAEAALTLATAVKAGDSAQLRTLTVPEYATDFSATEYLIRSTAPKIAGESLRVASVYSLDATARKADDKSDADFACPLAASTLETDFSIAGLPPGNYGFAMVEAAGGDHPWLLAFLLRQQGATWQMAGFYPHARTAAGHDGLWYWTAARDHVKAKEPWTAWLQYGEADTLLRPASFVASSHLDKLRNEQHAAAPPQLANGVSADTPLVVTNAKGAEFHFTQLFAESSADGSRVNIILHFHAEPATDAKPNPSADRARNLAAATAFVDAHPDLKTVFGSVLVFADITGQPPFATEHPMVEIQ